MILPILISVSLAPGSYFFCAWAVVATMAATASAVMATSFCMRTGIVFSPFFQSCCGQVSQVASTLASMCLFRMTKRHCCPAPIVINPARAASSDHFRRHATVRRSLLEWAQDVAGRKVLWGFIWQSLDFKAGEHAAYF